MADFGTAKQIDTSELSNSTTGIRRVQSQVALGLGKRLQDEEELVGSEEYISPEALSGEKRVCHQGADLWSLGVIIWQIFSKERVTPFAGATQEETFNKIVAGNYDMPQA